MDASSSPWNPTPAPVSSPHLLLPIPAIVFIAVGIYLLLLGLVLLVRHCLRGWAPRCPRCCPLCDCACACQLPDCQSLNCLCFEIKLR
uniref:Aldolase, fructose-bisphosphate A n=1 Tax=Prolemur simus TaxID=1328070 RepID=A0A8C9AMC2_PROSS